jgi:AcrR family transcriptional regulator
MDTGCDTPKLRADAERNRRKLLDAAARVFTERGLDVTLDEIAREAGVGTGTAYRRFPNKGALIDALMVERIGALVEIAEDCLENEPDPWLALRGYFERALDLQARDRGLKDILFSGAYASIAVAESRRRLAPVVGQLVQNAIEAGVVRDDLVPSDIALMNFMLNTVVDFGRSVQPELYRRYLGILLDGLRPSRDAPTPLPVGPLTLEQYVEGVARWR